MIENPKIIHRTYFTNFPPYKDPFTNYLETWMAELPTYKIHLWNELNTAIDTTEWLKKARDENAPVFLSEALRWQVLAEYGGLYLDADCEIVNGIKLHSLLEEMYASTEYDAFCGVEDFYTGIPTAQTIAAKKGAEIVEFMNDLYTNYMRPFWAWRETHNMLGPHLMSLYFYENGWRGEEGYFKHLTEPIIVGRVKIYPQDFFSPKFGIDGDALKISKNTCVYHLFANLNVDFSSRDKLNIRNQALTLDEYRKSLDLGTQSLNSTNSKITLRAPSGELLLWPTLRYILTNPITAIFRWISLLPKKRKN